MFGCGEMYGNGQKYYPDIVLMRPSLVQHITSPAARLHILDRLRGKRQSLISLRASH